MITSDSLRTTLDQAYRQITSDPQQAAAAMAAVIRALCLIRNQQAPAEWQATIADCRRHPIGHLMLDDPLTRRSFTQPRGYAGDAALIDMIYSRDWRGVTPAPTVAGQAIFEHVISCPAPAAVRARRELLAGMIDEACARTSAPHILSVACGHLRELALSSAFRAGQVGRLVGLDQDALSLAEVTSSQPAAPVETIPGSIKLLFGGALAREKFDFIYTAGLYDYLEEDFARRLTRRMFDMLRPGGRLLVANFQPGVEDVGYMEAFMNWKLIYRDATAMDRLAADIPAAEIGGRRTYADPSGALVFLELDRAPAAPRA